MLKGSLTSAAQLLSSWSTEAATLSSDWAMGVDAEGHLWQGPAYQDSDLVAFQGRIEQVIVAPCLATCRHAMLNLLPLLMGSMSEGGGVYGFPSSCCVIALYHLQMYCLRELHEELAALFSQEEAAALGLPAVLEPFAQLPVLHVSSHTGAAWESAHNEHLRRLEAVEERAGQKLKELFGEASRSCMCFLHCTAISVGAMMMRRQKQVFLIGSLSRVSPCDCCQTFSCMLCSHCHPPKP